MNYSLPMMKIQDLCSVSCSLYTVYGKMLLAVPSCNKQTVYDIQLTYLAGAHLHLYKQLVSYRAEQVDFV